MEGSARSWVDHAAAAEEWEREHAAEWARVDQELRGLAARRAALDAEEARLLRHAEELKLWRAYGFGNVLEYMERVLGYAPHTAVERLRVARRIAELPRVEESLERGELAYSAVRELSRVAIAETEAAWLEVARGKSLREIEAMVVGHKPGDLPTDETEPRLHRRTIRIELSPETYDLWRQMHALAAEEHGQRLSDDELIPALFRKAYGSEGEKSAGSPAYKIALKQCPDCKRAWQYGGGRDIEVDPAVVECATCDAVHLGSLDAAVPERATTTVTPRKREQVLARDGHCCSVPGCRRTTGLDLHHIEYQSRGGGHDLSNVIAICNLHHKAVHYGKLVIRGSAPDRVTFEFRNPRHRRSNPDSHASSVSSHVGAHSTVRPAPHSSAPSVHDSEPSHVGAHSTVRPAPHSLAPSVHDSEPSHVGARSTVRPAPHSSAPSVHDSEPSHVGAHSTVRPAPHNSASSVHDSEPPRVGEESSDLATPQDARRSIPSADPPANPRRSSLGSSAPRALTEQVHHRGMRT